MAKRIFSIVEDIALLSTQQGGYASRQEIVRHLTRASQAAFNALIPAKSGRPMGPGLNREVNTRLAPFLTEQAYATTPTTGQLSVSQDGRFYLPAPGYVSFYDVPGSATVQEVAGMAWRERVTDPNCGPTAKYPIVRDVPRSGNIGKQMLPPPNAFTLDLYTYPVEPVYAEDYGTGVAVYNDTNSVDTGWGLEMEPELIVRTLRLLGLEIRDPQLAAVAAQLTAETL